RLCRDGTRGRATARPHRGRCHCLTALPTAVVPAKAAPMLLAVDAGNTNLVFALVDEGAIKARWRIATDPRRTADQYAVWLHQLLDLEGYAKDDVDAVIIGTVVPP